MKTVYFIYVSIPEFVFNKIKYMIGDIAKEFKWKENKLYGLYAWTNKQSYVEEFLELRCNEIYTIVKKELDYDDFKRLKKQCDDMRLNLYKMKTNYNETMEIVCTVNEYTKSTEECDLYMDEFGLNIDEDIHYYIFNDEIFNALDILGYVDGYVRRYGYDGDVISYQNSFGLTGVGNKLYIDFHNEVGNFIVLFRFFLTGDDDC